MPNLDALLGAVNKSNVDNGSTIKVCFVGNYPDVCTRDDYLRETKNVDEAIRAAISSQGNMKYLMTLSMLKVKILWKCISRLVNRKAL